MPDPTTSPPPASRAVAIIAATCLLGILYVGRDFLKLLALAAILSLVLAPLKRKIARRGLGHTAGSLISVVLVGTCLIWITAVLTSQLVDVAADLPQYKAEIRGKLERVRDLTAQPLERIESELGGVVPPAQAPALTDARPGGRAATAVDATSMPMPVQILEARPTATDALGRVFSWLWGPIGQAGIVLLLLVFILLEHEGLRDRVIRLAGEAEAGRTMQAVEDAAQGVSRFFFSQFLVNATFGAVLGVVLWAVGVPHAALWGAVGALARFVPYIGVLAAGAAITAFAAAVDPGWSLMVWSVVTFLALEVFVAHVVEPRLYGHSTGLAPLGVIVSALFWGALWGPVGLLISTPLTLCLVVAGRHVRALEPISVLFGEAPGLTAGVRLYQRALSGESREIVVAARAYLRRSNFARYCDQILLPGLALAATDHRGGRIGGEQQVRIHHTIATVAESLAAVKPQEGASRRRRSTSLLEADVGAHLRQVRDEGRGRWRGVPRAPAGALVLCMAFEPEREALLTDLLLQALRDEGIDSRAISPEGLAAGVPDAVSIVFVVYPRKEAHGDWKAAVAALRATLPQAMVVTSALPFEEGLVDLPAVAGHVDLVVQSFSEAVAFALADRQGPG